MQFIGNLTLPWFSYFLSPTTFNSDSSALPNL